MHEFGARIPELWSDMLVTQCSEMKFPQIPSFNMENHTESLTIPPILVQMTCRKNERLDHAQSIQSHLGYILQYQLVVVVGSKAVIPAKIKVRFRSQFAFGRRKIFTQAS